MLTYWKTHLAYVVLICLGTLGAYVAVHSWLEEHDARLLATQQEKISEQVIKTQKDKIAADQATIETLSASITQVENSRKSQIALLQKQLAAVQTPQEAAAALNLPLVDASHVQINALDLLTERNKCSQDTVNLAACQTTLATTQDIGKQKDDQLNQKQGIVDQQDAEIAVLRHPKGFWKRLATNGKVAAVGGVLTVLGVEVLRVVLTGHP